MLESPYPSTQGRKAIRTLTAPLFFNNPENICATNKDLLRYCLDSPTTTSQPNLNGRVSRSDISSSSDHIGRKLSVNGVHELRDRSLPGTISKQEVHSVYSLHQHRKNTYIQIRDPINNENRSPSRQTRRREVIHCWSRERITRSETILSIRPPSSKQTERNIESNNLCKSRLTASTSAFNNSSFLPIINKSESFSSLPTAIRHIPIQLADNHLAHTQSITNDALKSIPISNQFPEIKRQISNKIQKLSFSYIEYSEYIDNSTQISNNHESPIEQNSMITENLLPTTEINHDNDMNSQNIELNEIIKRQIDEFQNDSKMMQINENRIDSLPSCSNNNSNNDDNVDSYNNNGDDDDENSSASRYSTAESSPCEDFEPNINKFNKIKKYNTDNQNNKTIGEKIDKLRQNKNSKEKLTNSTMNNQSVALEFRTIVQRDEYGYGFRVCGNKPVSVHNVRKDGNAEKAGLKAGDQIIEVNGILAIDLNHEDVVEQIRSRNQVSLRLRRLRYQVVDGLTGYRVGSMRNLTCNEAPILRSQQRHHYQKRRSVRESSSTGNTASAVVRRRPRLGTQTFKIARSCSPPPLASVDSMNDSMGPHTDEDIDWRKEEETNLEPNPDLSPQIPPSNAASLPPTSRMVRPRSSIGPSDRTSKERPVSSGPDMFGLFKRGSVKDVNHPECLKEEDSPMDGSSRDTTTANNKNSSNGSNSSNSSSSKSLSRMSFPGHSKSNGTSNKKTTGNLKDQSTFSSSTPPLGHVMGRNFDDEGCTTHRRCGSDTRHKQKKANTLKDFHLLPSFLHRNNNANSVDNPHDVVASLDETINSSCQDSSGLNETSSISGSGGGDTSINFPSPGLSKRDSISSMSVGSTCQTPVDSYLQSGIGQTDKIKSNGEEFGIMGNDSRYVKQMKNLYEGSEIIQETIPTSRSDSVVSNISLNLPASSNTTGPCDRPVETTSPPASSSLSSPVSNINETVRELVTTDWSDDPEMIAGASFEAAVELRAQFPNFQMPSKGQKSEEYIRTLVLLEFHQKTQYMVRHLKQYEYLLLRRWPVEHAKLSKILCLDQIPILINLFRSLVTCIDQTKTEQGYRGMAEAVLAWLTDNSSANLKTWARHCQALSCSNMLESVRHSVRDYVRRHPDIVPLLQTRHNKFVLIEGLKQMRILYFNLPLIANNIAKDLEKRTKIYKAEAKIWQQIQLKLASLPQTIDNVCMPLVKRINLGQLCTSLDKKDILSKPLPDLLLPFQHLLLNFPRVLFHHWVVAHAEVTVDKLTANRSNKVNHDYICERTEMLAILLHNALILMVKDGERYILRSFKAVREQGGGSGSSGISSTSASNSSTVERLSSFGSPCTTSEKDRPNSGNISGYSSISSCSSLISLPGSNTQSHTSLVSAAASAAVASMTDRSSTSLGSSKLVPIFPLIDVFTSCGEKFGGDHLLNIVFMKQTVLIRLLFSKEDERQNWSAYIQENSVTTQSIDRQRVLKPSASAAAASSSPSSSTQNRSTISITSESLIPKASGNTPTADEVSVITPQPSTQDLKTSFGKLPTTSPTTTNNDKTTYPSDISRFDLISSGEESTVFVDKLQTAMNELLGQTRQIICEKYNISKEELANAMNESDDVDDILNPGKILLFQIKYFAKCYNLITRTLAPQPSTSFLNQIQDHLESINDKDHQELEILMRQKKRQSSLSWTEGYLESLSRNPVLNVGRNKVIGSTESERSRFNVIDALPDDSKAIQSSPNLVGSDSERSRIEIQDKRKSKRRSRKSEAGPVSNLDFTFFDNLLNKELITMAPVFAKSVMCLCKLTHHDLSPNNLLKESSNSRKRLSRPSIQIDSQIHWTKTGDIECPVSGSTEEIEDEEVRTLANSIIDLSCSQTTDTLRLDTLSTEQSDAIHSGFDLSADNSDQDLDSVAAQLVSDVLENAKNYFSNHITKSNDAEQKTVNVIRDSGCAPSATDEDEDYYYEEEIDDDVDDDHVNNDETVKEITENHNDILTSSGTISTSDTSTPKFVGVASIFDDASLDQSNQLDKTSSIHDDLLIDNDVIDVVAPCPAIFMSGITTSIDPSTIITTTTTNIITNNNTTITTNIGRNDSQKSTTSSGYVDSSDD
ncbi:unnamed protein product [Schistosoma rodhaini]|nr:unnamed protein product [Schistosoma rodhaini]